MSALLSTRLGRLTVLAYGTAALVTFGHCAAHETKWRDANCATLNQRIDAEGTACYQPVLLNALFAAAAWPLYWSWEAQS